MDLRCGLSLRNLTLLGAVAITAGACGESPTGVPAPSKDAGYGQQVCYIVGGTVICTTTSVADTLHRP